MQQKDMEGNKVVNKKYYVFGYSDYIKNSLSDILNMDNVTYFDYFVGKTKFEQAIHRIFISRYTHIFSRMTMPFWKDKYWKGKKPERNSELVLILYEINPLSNKQQWIKAIRQEYPKVKIVYIFTNVINNHTRWRIEQIEKRRELYDLVLTFNKSDADMYGLTHYEGVFSAKKIDSQLIGDSELCDVYFCGLDKGRLEFLREIYDYLSSKGVKCIFDIISPQNKDIAQAEGFRFHDELINNEKMLANVCKAKCILEVMVDKSQPGSSLRMCESIAYRKKLLTNNKFAEEKPFFNKKQMRYFEKPEDIDINFIFFEVRKEDYLPQDILSPKKLLSFIEEQLNEVVQN